MYLYILKIFQKTNNSFPDTYTFVLNEWSLIGSSACEDIRKYIFWVVANILREDFHRPFQKQISFDVQVFLSAQLKLQI